VSQPSETVLVVICHYNARPNQSLMTLLDQMQCVPAGSPFRVRVVVNLARPQKLELPQRHGDVEVLYRENIGYNIGAWEAGWRRDTAYAAYLFLQEECRLVQPNWIGAFFQRASEPDVGLVGECLSEDWNASWEELARRFRGVTMPGHQITGQPAERVPCYLDFLRHEGIEPGPKGDHLQSLVLFARRQVLEAMGGFPVGRDHGEAIASEIGITKKVQALRLRACEVGPGPFTYIVHPQWLHLCCHLQREICLKPG
jgi:hypothetical protein